jgi:cytochrome P450
MTFMPERFLETDGNTPERDPNTFAFGFGRRICPGRELATNSIYLTIAQALAVFSLGKPVDDDGKEVDLIADFQPGVVSHPVPYKLTVKPRSPEHEALLRAFEVEHPWEESDAPSLPAFKH